MKVTQSCPTLYDPMNCSLPGSSVHGIFQARIMEWVPLPFPGDFPDSGNQPIVSCITGRFFTFWVTKVSLNSFLSRYMVSVAQLCPTLCNPRDCSTPGFPVLHHLLELVQSHVQWVGDAIQPSCHPLLLLPSIVPSILYPSSNYLCIIYYLSIYHLYNLFMYLSIWFPVISFAVFCPELWE